MYNILIEEFCDTYNLGEVVEKWLFPKGMNNQTFFVATTKGKYVIKALNPKRVATVKKREAIMIGEHIAKVANEAGINSIFAKLINGEIMIEFKNQYYMVFDFCEGEILPLEEMTLEICSKMGELLAKLHQTDFEQKHELQMEIPKYSYGRKHTEAIDWQCYYNQISKKKKPKWFDQFETIIPQLNKMFARTHPIVLKFESNDYVISHSDFSHANTLWINTEPYLIDWETAGYIDATYNCFYTAIRFAIENQSAGKRVINPEKVKAFLAGYASKRRIDVKQLKKVFDLIIYKRLNMLNVALKTYSKSNEAITKRQVTRRIKFSLSILKSYQDFERHLPELKTYIITQQPDLHNGKYYFTFFSEKVKVKIASIKRGDVK